MSFRKSGQTLQYRRNDMPWRVYDLINRRDCLHVDAWLLQAPDNRLYFLIQSSAGGRQLLRETWLRVDGMALTPVAALDAGTMTRRYINTAWARRHAPQLALLHETVLRPTYWQPVAVFTGHRSIALHYVYSDARTDDPLAGVDNQYSITRRGELYPDNSNDDLPTIAQDIAPTLDASARSQLRTLDKVLGTHIASERTANKT